LAPLPERFQADRRELLGLLLQRGILHRSPTQPVASRDGQSARWMLNSLGVTLSSRGAELAGRCVLELLKHFDGRQLATYGLIGTPIMQSCILQSGGRYNGLLVRKEAKTYGASRIIEGEINPDEPVILIDDSIASGTAFNDGCERLEKAGLRVEGGICLVRFGWLSGYSAAQERGYHVEAVFDIFEDFMANMDDEPKPLRNPSKTFPAIEWSPERAPEGLHPAALARLGLAEYLASGKLLRPPQHLDKQYDSSGGAWISLRSKANVYLRHARDGFWHFPGEERWSTPEDVLRAVIRTATLLPQGAEGLAKLESSSIAVTFFSALEECTVGELDNNRYGIVVSSAERASVMGGALPRMPGINHEYHQFQHARITNGKLYEIEPYVIHRHDVFKFVEPGADWQPTGVPRTQTANDDTGVCTAIAVRARELALAHVLGVEQTGTPLPDSMKPEGLHSLYVTIYIWGKLRGCMGAVITSLDRDLSSLVLSALQDERFTEAEAGAPEAFAVSVSLLSGALTMGQFTPEEVVKRSLHGRQALRVYQNKREGMLLPFVAGMYDLDPVSYAREVIDKAGITRAPYHWQRFDCITCLADSDGAGVMQGAFRQLEQPATGKDLVLSLASLHTRYLVRHQKADGSFYESYEPCRNRLREGTTPPRQAYGIWVMARAAATLNESDSALREAADKGVDRLLNAMQLTEAGAWLELNRETPSVSEISFLTLALCELPQGDYRRPLARSFAQTLWQSIGRHGRIETHRGSPKVSEAYQDYFPAQVLLALAAAAEAGLTEVNLPKLMQAFRYYRHRFRYKRDFGHVSWMMQAFSRWWKVKPEAEFADLVFEIGDWALQFQQKSGAFLTGHQIDTPGFTTALYLEGIGSALALARASHSARHNQYLDACLRGMEFMDRLTIQPAHASVMPNSDLAIGGVRQSLYTSFVRIDFVQHALSALLELDSYFTAGADPAHTPVEAVAAKAETFC
jgi:AMMECR1 domain-containing protein/orotate phosphoribosyltransferase